MSHQCSHLSSVTKSLRTFVAFLVRREKRLLPQGSRKQWRPLTRSRSIMVSHQSKGRLSQRSLSESRPQETCRTKNRISFQQLQARNQTKKLTIQVMSKRWRINARNNTKRARWQIERTISQSLMSIRLKKRKCKHRTTLISSSAILTSQMRLYRTAYKQHSSLVGMLLLISWFSMLKEETVTRFKLIQKVYIK